MSVFLFVMAPLVLKLMCAVSIVICGCKCNTFFQDSVFGVNISSYTVIVFVTPVDSNQKLYC